VFLRRLVNGVARLDDMDIRMLWDKLFGQEPISDTMIFLVMDGTDHLEGDEQEVFRVLLEHINGRLLEPDCKTLNVRILLTATPESYQTIVRAIPNHPRSVIDMVEFNAKDMELFIDKELDKMKIFKSTSSHVSELRKEVVAGLVAIEKKTFAYLDFFLKDIKKKSIKSEIVAVLDRAKQNGGIEQSIREEVRRCNASLSVYEKSELNEMLLWVTYAARPLTVPELEAIIHLTQPEPSFQDLYDQIAGKYSTFFTISRRNEETEDDQEGRREATVVLANEHITKWLERASADQHEISEGQDGSINRTEVQILKNFLSTVCTDDLYYKFGFEEFFRRKAQVDNVNETEVKLVRKYLSTVCDGELYDRMGFADFFEKKLGDSSLVGVIDLETRRANVAKTCLQALCDSGEVAKELHAYAGEYFQDHLKEVNLSSIRLDLKVEIVQYIVRIFNEPEIIQRWWPMVEVRFRSDEWILLDEKSESTLSWLQDNAVNRRVAKPDQDWLKTLATKPHAGNHLLRPIVSWMSKTLLNDLNWNWRDDLCRGIWSFINKVSPRIFLHR
jgi:hypothetical protein